MRRSEATKLADRLDRKKGHDVEQIVRRNLANDSWAIAVRRELEESDVVLMFETAKEAEDYLKQRG